MVFYSFIPSVTQSIKFSAIFAVILEFISGFQIIHIILKTISHFAVENLFLLKIVSKTTQFFTVGFAISNYTQQKGIINTIWICSALYMLILLFLTLTLFLLHLRKKILSQSLIKILSVLLILHSKILFFPIQSFLLSLINFYQDTSCRLITELYCQIGWFVGTVCLCILNFLLAFVKEFIFYQHLKSKDFYACKTNRYHQALILYKLGALLVLLENENLDYLLKANSIFLVVFNSGLLYILYTKLPFYKFSILRITTIMSASSLSLSILSVIQAFVTNSQIQNGIQMIIPIVPFIGAKVGLLMLKRLFEHILKIKSLSPEYAVHFGLLLKELTVKYSSFLTDKPFFPSIHAFTGILAHLNINFTELQSVESNMFEKQKLYQYVIEKLEYCLRRNPSSHIVMIFLTQIYLKKFRNYVKTMDLLKILSKALKPSIHQRIAIDGLNNMLRKIRKIERISENKMLDVDRIFQYKELTNLMRLKMLTETKLHLEFWNNLRIGNIDIKTTIDQNEEIEFLLTTINRQFHKEYTNFQTNFQLPILMYSVYLKALRYLPYEALKYLERFRILVSNYSPENEFNIYSETSAVAIISLESTKAGQIIDVTENIHDLFEINRNDIIGFNFGCFFPQVIANALQTEVLNYIKAPNYRLDKSFKTYGKTSSGRIFEIEAHFQLFSHGGDYNQASIKLKRRSFDQYILLVDFDGTILNYSKDLEEEFGEENVKIQAYKKLQAISPDLDQANKAFNVLYGKVKESIPFTLASSTNEKLEDRKYFSSDTEEPLKINTRITVEDFHIESPGIFSGRDEDTLILSSAKKESHRALISPQGHKSYNFATVASVFSKILGKNNMPVEKAKQVCRDYSKGKTMTLCIRNSASFKHEDRLRGFVQIKKHILDGNLYKIVTITDLKREEVPSDQSDDDSQNNQKSHISFGDDFPVEDERRPTAITVPTIRESHRFRKQTLLANEKKKTIAISTKTHETKKKNLGILTESTRGSVHKEKHFTIKNRTPLDEEIDLSLDYTSKEKRFIRTLKELTNRKKLLPQLKYSMISLLAAFLLVITLASVTFYLSQRSIKEVEKGVKIVNLATQSLINIEKTWGWTTFLYAASVGFGIFSNRTLEVLQGSTKNDALFLSESTKAVRETLSSLHAKDFLKTTFTKNVVMYNPSPLGYLEKTDYDIFSATNYLITKYLSMATYTNLTELSKRDDTIFNLNNTANDYMIKSNLLIDQTDEFLQSLISRNLNTLRIMVIVQSLLLAIIFGLIISIPIIIVRIYHKFFQVLVSIKDDNIQTQINQLNKVQIYFNEEGVPFKTFIKTSYDLIDAKKVENIHVKSKTNLPTKRNKIFTSQKMIYYLLKFTIVSLFFIPPLIGLFYGSLLGSMSSFYLFEEIKDQMGVLGEAMEEANMLVNSFAFAILFGANPLMKIHNLSPYVQLTKSLDIFSTINNKLTHVFLQKENLDTDVVSMLKNDVCSYLSNDLQDPCLTTTKNGLNGLLSVNADYYQTSIYFFNRYQENPTILNALTLSGEYISITTKTLLTLNFSFKFLVDHILAKFERVIDNTLENERIYFGAVCATIAISMIYIYFVLIKKLKRIDFARRKILKIIPFDVVQQNKILSYYLRNSFRKEVDEIKNIL